MVDAMAYSVRRTPSSRARPVGWNNSFRYSLGLRYDPTLQWSLRLGTAYDETPGPSDVLRTPASRTPTAFRRSGLPSVGPTACASISGADPTKIRVRFGSCGVLGEGDIRPNADAGAPRRGSGPPPPRRGAAPARNRGAARRVRRDGPPAHLDGHLNMHLHPMVLPILRELAPRYGIRAVRLSREDLGAALRYDSRHLARKLFEGVVFRALAAYAGPRLAAAHIVTADRVYGMHQTGHVDEGYLLALIGALPAGVSEIYSHPAEEASAALAIHPPGYDHAGELRALTSARVRTALEAANVQLVSYADL